MNETKFAGSMARIARLGFKVTDDMSVAYVRRVLDWMTHGNAAKSEASFGGIHYTSEVQTTFKIAVASSEEEALNLLKQHATTFITGIQWLKANPKDFCIQVGYSRIEEGLGYTPSTVLVRDEFLGE